MPCCVVFRTKVVYLVGVVQTFYSYILIIIIGLELPNSTLARPFLVVVELVVVSISLIFGLSHPRINARFHYLFTIMYALI